MYFSHALVSFVALFATFVTAAPNAPGGAYPGTHPRPPPPPPQPPVQPAPKGCGNTGAMQCCNSLQESDSAAVSNIFNLLPTGLGLTGSTGQVGFACSPIIGDTGLGGATSCAQQTACCSGETQFNGVIAMGCSPFTLGGGA
ncbi:hypothetical protein HGRIS_011240 [Hohenbuehelia grisea]|uniref:Hydrophobin n=1 Tax=Hohenbuehelia grisea TaxID=104357 RepID=A0ABR3JVG2_9AGAR